MRQPELFIGTEGWDYDAWSGVFYPDDLPHDWRLTYYANEYRVVLVPHRIWSGAPLSTFETWASDVPPGFRFFLRASADGWGRGETARRLSACAQALGSHCAGVVADGASPTGPEAMGHPSIPIYLPHRPPEAGGSLYLAAPTGDPDGVDRVMLWASDALPDLPRRRRALEHLAAGCARDRDAVLFITGTPPSLEGVDETLTLARLLGLS